MFGWNERPSKASVKHHIGGDNPAVVYNIGKYDVTVPGPEVEVIYQVPYHYSTDPQKVLPNMRVDDGEIKIPITDFVEQILTRVAPVELAEALWNDPEVKEAFIERFTDHYYNGDVFGDADRRAFLLKVKEMIHNQALDHLARKASSLEYEIAKIAHFWQEVGSINETLKNHNITVPRMREVDGEWKEVQEPLRFRELDKAYKDEKGITQRGELEVAGKCWTEAIHWWREEVGKHFPKPEASE